MIIIG